MDLLKRNLAPLSQEAWAEIDNQARQILNGNLSARGLVDFDGPHGLQMASVNLGKVSFEESGVIEEVLFGVRKVLPLIEVRVPFALSLEEMDHISRGLKDPDLEPVAVAARKAAHFEEKAIFRGFEKGGIAGIVPSAQNPAISMKPKAEHFMEAAESAVTSIKKTGIGGPYAMVLGTEAWQMLEQGDQKGYPLKKRVQDVLGGAIVWSPAMKGGVVLSTRGGDFIFTLGQDFSIGYQRHDAENVHLYVTESITFQIVEPRAAVEIRIGE